MHEVTALEYASFWRRFGAYWLDVLIIFPITALAIWGNEQSRLFSLYYSVPGMLIGLWFHVYLVQRYGGTPGKLLLGIRITRLDGSPASYKEAMLRYSVLFVLSIAMVIALNTVVLEMTDAEYFSMDWQRRSLYMAEHAPVWYKTLTVAMQIWIWSEFIVMLTNKKRRAIHDFMAGTVVIRKPKEI
jgi:uncharacterized RDD family membrane protein YckC